MDGHFEKRKKGNLEKRKKEKETEKKKFISLSSNIVFLSWGH